ncbi:hypothetical protein MMC09_003411 [Bachmanniomyces sp. S44760]|nr:hypothetical protein [Bachmanniomyces sp. S44760]
MTLQGRIRQLEGLVLSLMQQNGSMSSTGATNYQQNPALGHQQHAAGVSRTYGSDELMNEDRLNEDREEHEADEEGEEEEQVLESFGHVNIDDDETSYVGASHWVAILDDIDKVKQDLDHNEMQPEKSLNSQGSSFLFGSTVQLSKGDILASIPDRAVVDRLVSRYFNSKDPAVQAIHMPKFLKEYECFWENPNDTPVMWIGILFGMMCMAMFFYQRSGDKLSDLSAPPEEVMTTYRNRSAQCLVLANWTRPGKHTLEALILHLQAEYSQKQDAHVSVWIIGGVLVRLAMRMGYHRDANHFSNISPFDGEMRRRVWAFISQFDLLSSFLIGLPSMIPRGQVDTTPPNNLADHDFDENTKHLPPSRPLTDPTEVSYTIAKARMCVAFGKITDEMQSTVRTSYEESMKLDRLLQESHDMLPPHLQMRKMNTCITDPAYLIMRRYNIELLYQKSRCILHRRYLTEARSDPNYAYSRNCCTEAAMELLRHQFDLDAEVQPGGQLYRDRWFVSTLAAHDFMLAAMIVCLELHHASEDHNNGQVVATSSESNGYRLEDMFNALEKSYLIWQRSREQSPESKRAFQALSVMLGRANQARFIPPEQGPSFSGNATFKREGSKVTVLPTPPQGIGNLTPFILHG